MFANSAIANTITTVVISQRNDRRSTCLTPASVCCRYSPSVRSEPSMFR
jgi:hypothetical protein